MTKEQILEKHLPHSWYTPVYPKNSHPIHDKDCLTCKVEDDIFNAMQEYADQELAKERERAAKLVEALNKVHRYLVNIGDFSCTPLIEQSLTEYEKL